MSRRVLSAFERWALALPVPALDLPVLKNAGLVELYSRADAIGYTGDWFQAGEKSLASIQLKLGALNYLEELCKAK